MPTNIFDNFEFRSHYMGELMTPAKGKSNKQKYEYYLDQWQKNLDVYMSSKNRTTQTALKAKDNSRKYENLADEIKPYIDQPHLGEKCKTRLIQIYTEVTTGRTKNIVSQFLEKGLHTEEDAITQYSIYKGEMFRKNKQRLHNGYIQGEMDFEEDEDTSVDNKSSWDAFTFDSVAVKPTNNNYLWQAHCYMWLFNKKRHKVLYSLMNTPQYLVDAQIRKMKYDLPPEMWEQAEKEIIKNNNFDDLPVDRKIRLFEVQRSDDKIDQMKEMIPHFRTFLNNIDNLKNTSDESTDDDDS